MRVTSGNLLSILRAPRDLPLDEFLDRRAKQGRHVQIVAALMDRKSTLKTFLLEDCKPFLKAENPKYPDLIPSDELMIQGVFGALIRKAKD